MTALAFLTPHRLSAVAASPDVMTIAQHLATIDRLCAEDFPRGTAGRPPGRTAVPGLPAVITETDPP